MCTQCLLTVFETFKGWRHNFCMLMPGRLEFDYTQIPTNKVFELPLHANKQLTIGWHLQLRCST